MDPLSQAGLGAVVAQATAHRKLGSRVVLYGAIAGALPDIDVLFSITGDFVDQLIRHRGITHSLFFAPVFGPLLGALVWIRERKSLASADTDRLYRWMLVLTLALLSHPLLDFLTPYGTQLLLPFSDGRFAVNAMPIIDPLYTLLLGAGLLVAGLTARRYPQRTRQVALTTLVGSTAYLGYGWVQNINAEQAAARQLAALGIETERVGAFPTVLQVHLRRVVARSPAVDRVGFYSTWSPCEISWFEAPRADRLALKSFLQTREGRVFDWFTMGWAHYQFSEQLSPAAGGGRLLTASDLRYGFDDDPFRSVFTLTARLDSSGEIGEPVRAGRAVPDDSGSAIIRLIENTYAPACRLFSAGAIPQPMEHNAPPAKEPGNP